MQKIIKFKTNYNGKLDCKCFVHIDSEPKSSFTEADSKNVIFEIQTLDQSHDPVKTKLIDIIRLPLLKITNALSYPSHGMDSTSFQEMMILSNDEMNLDKQMAVYFYEKIN